MYKILKTTFKGINLTVKNYATINLEKKINTDWISSPENAQTQKGLELLTFSDSVAFAHTQWWDAHVWYTDSEGMSECHQHLGCDHSHHMNLCPRGWDHAPRTGGRGLALAFRCGSGVNSGRQAFIASAVTQWASHWLKFWHTWYLSTTLNLCHFSPISMPILK